MIDKFNIGFFMFKNAKILSGGQYAIMEASGIIIKGEGAFLKIVRCKQDDDRRIVITLNGKIKIHRKLPNGLFPF